MGAFDLTRLNAVQEVIRGKLRDTVCHRKTLGLRSGAFYREAS